ncbi:DEAD/DEAH box helicase [Mesobacillus maritimus]|uniref:DEAD/DEAH box helicase n=1 Tax=Mesobacillus maritimus TaxID=1643336 RepID=UPI0038503217
MIFDRLAEDIFQDEYFKSLYNKLSKSKANEIFINKNQSTITEKELVHLLRFSDILSNSNKSEARNLAYKIVDLLSSSYNDNNPIYKTYSTAVLSKLGNFPALDYLKFGVELPFERSLEKGLKEMRQRVKGAENKYFTDSQYDLFSKLKGSNFYSFAGPTSMGKSFIMKAFIHEMIETNKTGNFVIVVPTRALINQFSMDIKQDLAEILNSKNYKVLTNSTLSEITTSNDGDNKYIFILTPERLLRYISEKDNPEVHYLLVDEAHKLTAEDDYRSITLYLSIERTLKKFRSVKVYFASPNVSNPEIFLELFNIKEGHSFRTKEAPVGQNLFFIDLVNKKVKQFNEYEEYVFFPELFKNVSSGLEVIYKLAGNHSNIIYCNSIADTVENARSFKDYFSNNKIGFTSEDKKELSKAIRNIKELIHDDYYLIDCLKNGIGYHFGSLPQIVRDNIEKLFKQGVIKHLFCTSTLLEGVNLPAKNVFILKNKKGLKNISKIDFWNLAGRAGRLNFELSGNIFCIRDNIKDWKKIDVLNNKEDIKLKTSVNVKIEKKLKDIEQALQNKEIKKGSHDEKELLKFIANIICIDTLELKNGYKSPIIDKLINENKYEIINHAQQIINNNKIPGEVLKTNQFINIQQQNKVYEYLINNKNQPDIIKFPNTVNFESSLRILELFYTLYNWSESEKRLKHFKSMRYFAQLMNNWINGFSLNWLISQTLNFKHTNKLDIMYYYKGKKIIETFNKGNQLHVNYEINSLIDDVEHVLRFTFEKYFNNYYSLLAEVVGENEAGVNWSNFLEFGTQDSIVIALQNIGLSRHTSNFLLRDYKNCLIIENGKLIDIDKKRLLFNLDSDSIEYDEINSIIPYL